MHCIDLADYLQFVGGNETEYNKLRANPVSDRALWSICMIMVQTLMNRYLWYRFEAMESEERKEEIWRSILTRFLQKETANHWCRAAASVWNYYRKIKISGLRNAVQPDMSCLESQVMAQYIGHF